MPAPVQAQWRVVKILQDPRIVGIAQSEDAHSALVGGSDLTLHLGWVKGGDALGELFPETKGYSMIGLLPVSGIAPDCAPSERHALRKPLEEIVERL